MYRHMHELMDEWMTRQFGRDVGLNADWWCSAWRIDPFRYVCDNEDGTWSIIDRTTSTGGEYTDTALTSGLTDHGIRHWLYLYGYATRKGRR